MSVTRYNLNPFKLNLEPDSDGFLRCNNVVALKAGIAIYTYEDGKEVRELIRPEEINKAESYNTLKVKPVTLEHRTNGKTGMVNAKNYDAVGSTGSDVRFKNDELIIDMGLHTEKGVNYVTRENASGASAGYGCAIKEGGHKEHGLWRGKEYDREQIDIRYNHLTVTKSPRINDCRIRLNSGDAILAAEELPPNQEPFNENKMEVTEKLIPAIQIGEVKFNSEKIKIPKDQEKVVDDLLARTDLVVETYEKLNASNAVQVDKLNSDITELNGKLEAKKDFVSPKEVEELATIKELAKEFKVNSKDANTVVELKAAIVKATGKFPEDKLNGAYLDAAFDQVKSNSKDFKKFIQSNTAERFKAPTPDASETKLADAEKAATAELAN